VPCAGTIMADQAFDRSLFDFNGGTEWEQVFDGGGFKAWRRIRANTQLYEYRTVGVLKDVPPKQYNKFYLDILKWKAWDTNMETVEIIQKEADTETVDWVYWSVKYPIGFSNRDYVYKRHVEDKGDGVYIIRCKAENHTNKPATNKRVRVDNYECFLALTDADEGKSVRIFMDYFEDLKMSIPNWLVNWVTKTAVPEFLKKLSAQAKIYQE